MPREETRFDRVTIFLLVLALPLMAFPLGASLGPEWQSGSTGDRIALHLDPEVTILFAPFIVLAWVTTLVAIAAERTVARWRATRLALYSGVILTAHYLVLSLIVLSVAIAIAFVIVAVALLGLRQFHRLFGAKTIAWTCAGVIALGVPIFVLSAFDPNEQDNPIVVVLSIIGLLLTLAGPAICFLAAVHRSRRVWLGARHAGATSLPFFEGIGVVGWAAGYTIAWRTAAERATELYNELPPTQGDCYVATAAAAGHPLVVRSTSGGVAASPRAINPQLQTLKLAEIAIAANWPGAHRRVRRFYNWLWPRLAAQLSTPWRADAAYLLLKPCEALGMLVNWVLVPDARMRRSQMYSPSGSIAAGDHHNQNRTP